MIYLKDEDRLTSNVILPFNDNDEDALILKKILLNFPEAFCSSLAVHELFQPIEEQKKYEVDFSGFLCDNNMLCCLDRACDFLEVSLFNYFLKKVSIDYYCFAVNIVNDLRFRTISSYNIRDLEAAHRVNKRFGIQDNYNEILSRVNVADTNSKVLRLAKKINDNVTNF